MAVGLSVLGLQVLICCPCNRSRLAVFFIHEMVERAGIKFSDSFLDSIDGLLSRLDVGIRIKP